MSSLRFALYLGMFRWLEFALASARSAKPEARNPNQLEPLEGSKLRLRVARFAHQASRSETQHNPTQPNITQDEATSNSNTNTNTHYFKNPTATPGSFYNWREGVAVARGSWGKQQEPQPKQLQLQLQLQLQRWPKEAESGRVHRAATHLLMSATLSSNANANANPNANALVWPPPKKITLVVALWCLNKQN